MKFEPYKVKNFLINIAPVIFIILLIGGVTSCVSTISKHHNLTAASLYELCLKKGGIIVDPPLEDPVCQVEGKTVDTWINAKYRAYNKLENGTTRGYTHTHE